MEAGRNAARRHWSGSGVRRVRKVVRNFTRGWENGAIHEWGSGAPLATLCDQNLGVDLVCGVGARAQRSWSERVRAGARRYELEHGVARRYVVLRPRRFVAT